MAKAKAPRPRSDAPPPRRPAPRTQGSPVLIIFLVFFILIGLTLGIFLYLAQEKITNAETLAKTEATKSQKLAGDYADLQKYYDIKIRQWIDAGTVNPQEVQDAGEIENRFASGTDPRSKEFKSTIDVVKGLIGTPNSGVATTYFKGLVELLKNQVANTEKNRKEFEANYQKALADLEAYKKEWNAAKFDNDWKENAQKLEAEHARKLAEKEAVIAKNLADIDAVKKDHERLLTDEKARNAAERKVIEQRVADEVEKIEKFRLGLIEKSEAARNIVIGEDSPKVIRADINSEVVYINIGEGDRVPPDLTFNIYERGPGGKPNLIPKASGRVIQIVGKGVSMLRITRVAKPEFGRNRKDGSPAAPEEDDFWITDPRDFYKSRNPVQPGDLLNNPAWKRNSTVHVFLLGMFDLDGDTHDDIETFRRMLKEMGAEVDGYLDPANDYEMKGRIDYQTDILIRGSMPVTGGKSSLGKLVENGAKVEAEALKKGIRIEPVQRFLTQMGFTAVRVPTGRPSIDGAPAAPGAANGEKKDAAPMQPMEEKKPKKEVKEEEEDKKKP